MADRMTPEQVATLELPEGWETRLDSHGWVFLSRKPAAAITIAECRLVDLGEAVANGELPRSVYDWARRAYKGQEAPTVEQWEAAERLAALTRNDAHPDSIVTKLANIISPPKPPLPEIAACPRCGQKCQLAVTEWQNKVVKCCMCNWAGPATTRNSEAIEGHNSEARRLRPEPQPEPIKRTCGGCRHFDPAPGLLCRTAYYTGGQSTVLNRPAVPTRDASECERWESRT